MHIASLLLLPLILGAAGPETQDSAGATGRAPVLDHKKLRQAMTRLASEHASLVSVLGVAWSRGEDGESRRIEALRLAAGELSEGRPAILVVANLDGPLVYTSGVAFGLARELATRYASDERVRALLDTTTVYVVPRANPDAAEARFRSPLQETRASGRGVDEDRDGLSGEDPPEDVDGDGNVTWMRVPDPEGTWVVDPTEPRVLVEAKRAEGERGTWKLVREGRDADADGETAEDPLLAADVNRNFAAGFEEHAARAGLYPTAEPEARGLCEFVMAHPDVQLVLVYGELDNLSQAPESVDDDAPDSGRLPPSGLRKSDAELIAELGRRYRAVVGSTPAGSGDDAGTFQRWCYEHRGLVTLSARLFEVPAGDDEGEGEGEEQPGEAQRAETQPAAAQPAEPRPSDDALRLRWLEANGVTGAHLGWRAFDHPDLGPVEIGGFRPYALVEPPAADRERMVGEQADFVLSLGEVLARIALVDVTAEDLSGGLLDVRATVTNDALLPLRTRWGHRTETTRPAKVLLRLPPGAELLAGERQILIGELAGLGGRRELTWLVRGAEAGTIGVSAESDHAGSVQATPEVKR